MIIRLFESFRLEKGLQIKGHEYEGALKDFSGNLLLVGINYDKKEKEYNCQIETYTREKI